MMKVGLGSWRENGSFDVEVRLESQSKIRTAITGCK